MICSECRISTFNSDDCLALIIFVDSDRKHLEGSKCAGNVIGKQEASVMLPPYCELSAKLNIG